MDEEPRWTFMGAQHPELWEARREVVRRAIEYLENRDAQS
jgi:hypothetical protein